jgi:hypothetical protein
MDKPQSTETETAILVTIKKGRRSSRIHVKKADEAVEYMCGGRPGSFPPAARDVLPLSYSVAHVTAGNELQINLVHRV